MPDEMERPAKKANLQHLVVERTSVAKLSREELEDRYLRLYEENLNLKQEVNSQEEKIKKMATKLLRLVGEGKSDARGGINVDEMAETIATLEQQNALLKDKLKTAKHQLTTYANTSVSQSRAGGRLGSARSERITKDLRVVGPSGQTRRPSITPSPLPTNLDLSQSHRSFVGGRGAHSAFDNNTVVNLTTQRQQLELQLNTYEREINQLREELNTKQQEYEENLNKMRSLASAEQKSAIQENVDTIRLQRLIKEKTAELSHTQAKLSKLEQDLKLLKETHDSLISEFDQINNSLRAEQNLTQQLRGQLRSYESNRNVDDQKLRNEIDSFKQECDILRSSNSKLLSSAFDTDREKQRESVEKALRGQILQMESALKADVNTRNELLEKLANEIASKDVVQRDFRTLQTQNLQLKSKCEELEQKVKQMTEGMGMNWSEMAEAMVEIRMRKQVGSHRSQLTPHSSVQKSLEIAMQEELADLKASFSETVKELEKTRNMLLLQHKINGDYQKEVELTSSRAESQKHEYEQKLKEFAQLLDHRATRIQKLEKQLRDLAYGTKPYKSVSIADGTDKQMLKLEPGKDVLEIRFSKLNITEEAVRYMQDRHPSVFLTVEFFDFELQFSPILQGPRAEFDFVALYEVEVNDLFLHYLQTDNVICELHQAAGTAYKTWAAGKISCRNLFDKSPGTIVGSLEFSGTSSEVVGVAFGSVQFSLELKVPLAEALTSYKMRTKALGYILTDDRLSAELPQSEGKSNQLHIQIHRCQGLKTATGQNPSAYVVYQFYGFPDHDTPVVPTNSNPEIDDKFTWDVQMTSDLDNYLRTKTLKVVVFDDSANTDDLAYLGRVDIPLLPLAHDKPIRGTFQLQTPDSSAKSSIDVSIHWQFAYIPPLSQLKIVQPAIELPSGDNVDIIAPADSQPQYEPSKLSKINFNPAERPPEQPKILPTPKLIIAEPVEIKGGSDQVETAVVVETEQISKEKPPKPLVRKNSYTIETKKSSEPSELPKISPLPPLIPIAPVRDVVKPTIEDVKLVEPTVEDVKPIAPATESLPPIEPVQTGIDTKLPSTLPPVAPRRKQPPTVTISEKAKFDRSSDEDEEDLVVISAKSPWQKPESLAELRMELISLTLAPESTWLSKFADKNEFFVEWKFLDVPTDDCETPESFAFPKSSEDVVNISYHLIVPLHGDTYKNRVELLKQFLKTNSHLTLTVVMEPQEGDCEEIGEAEVKLSEILTANSTDTAEISIEVMDLTTRTCAAQIRVGFGGLDSIRPLTV